MKRATTTLTRTGAPGHHVQVKAVSSHSTTRRISPIHEGWNELWLFRLDRSFAPEGLWILDARDCDWSNSTLKASTLPRGTVLLTPSQRRRITFPTYLLSSRRQAAAGPDRTGKAQSSHARGAIGVVNLCDALERLQSHGVLAEPCGESPTVWRATVPITDEGPFPILEAFRIALPCFEADCGYRWGDPQQVLFVWER